MLAGGGDGGGGVGVPAVQVGRSGQVRQLGWDQHCGSDQCCDHQCDQCCDLYCSPYIDLYGSLYRYHY